MADKFTATQRAAGKLELGQTQVTNLHGLTTNRSENEGEFDDWTIQDFCKDFEIRMVNVSEEILEFDMLGAPASIANTFRRIMIAEVPTMAIEHVELLQNTSEIPDEMLVHRIGLIPIKANPDDFVAGEMETGCRHADKTLEFHLTIKCRRNPIAPKGACDPDLLYLNHILYSKHLKWVPIENQRSKFGEIRPAFEDILIAKLRPGQEIEMRMLCIKGIGKSHAKFSPVGTASYRLLPEISLKKQVEGDLADLLQSCFSPGVIDVENFDGKRVAKVSNSRLDSGSRNVFIHDDLKDCVEISRVRNHFIFLVESTGCIPVEQIFRTACGILKHKATRFIQAIQEESGELA